MTMCKLATKHSLKREKNCFLLTMSAILWCLVLTNNSRLSTKGKNRPTFDRSYRTCEFFFVKQVSAENGEHFSSVVI